MAAPRGARPHRNSQRRKPMGSLILQIKYGGLGDHLFYSHIPRLAKDLGMYDRVFISNRSEFRHSDYRKYVWELNPYVDGFVDEPGVDHVCELSDPGRENLLD